MINVKQKSFYSIFLVVPKPTMNNEINDKHRSSDDYTESLISNPLVASTVDDFIPDDTDYETFLIEDNTTSQQHLSIDPFNKSSTTKLSITDELVIFIFEIYY